MSDSEKPFACPSPGCNMSFSNEDHLMVHRRKHDMSLNLENNNKGNIFIIDQTPTPTRFIRNCEEVGLFQDLQNVNPFEETFRRAVEAGKSGTPSISDTELPDDTLHTPHIFPAITSCQPANDRINVDVDIDELSTNTVPVIDTDSNGENNLLGVNVHNAGTGNESVFQHMEKTVNIIFHSAQIPPVDSRVEIKPDKAASIALPKIAPKQSSPPLCINGEEVQLLLKTADGKVMQLSAVPVTDNHGVSGNNCDVGNRAASRATSQTVFIKTVPALKCANKSSASQLSLAKMKLKQVLTRSSTKQQSDNNVETGDGEEDVDVSYKCKGDRKKKSGIEQSKKLEMRERNRASSMRCRAKRKEWTHQLQRTISCANEKNAALQLEIKNLHTEITKLKAFLMAHKDCPHCSHCPVTKAMETGNGVVVGSKIISIKAGNVIPMNSQGKIVFNAKNPISAKKMRFSPPTNSVILPKSDFHVPQQTPIFLKTVDSLLNIEAMPERDKRKRQQRITNIPNTVTKSRLRIDGKIIESNPIIDTRNVAAESAGT